MILIEDPSDPRIQPYRDVRERDLVGRSGMFMAEGEVVLRQLVANQRFETVSVLLAQKRYDRLSTVIQTAAPGAPIYVASQPVMDQIAGFPLHRGVLAIGRRVGTADPRALLANLGRPAVVLAVVGVSNHDNMGGLFRNAAAFGVDAILIDSTSCDPLYRKAIRVSVGAVLLVPYARMAPGDDLVAALQGGGFELVALAPRGSSRLGDLQLSSKMAVVFGAEGPGLPQAVLSRCRTVRIPMALGFDSLNLATASGIVLHHLLEGKIA